MFASPPVASVFFRVCMPRFKLQSPPQHSPSLVARARLFCHNCDSSTDVSTEDGQKTQNKQHKPSLEIVASRNSVTPKDSKRSRSESDLNFDESGQSCKVYVTSTPACLPLRTRTDMIFTPEEQERKSMSPITRSTQRMTRAMQVRG